MIACRFAPRKLMVVGFAAMACAIASLPWPAATRAMSGGSDGGSVGFADAESSPGQRAISEYRTGEQRLERARDLRLEIVALQGAGRGDETVKLEREERRSYERAARAFEKALRHDEGLFQAWSSLGYALRRLGRHAEALAAYDRAIELEPRYAEAVEYRAEAYLQLGRLEEAKAEYLRLSGWVAPMALRLRQKMELWYQAHATAPDPFDPDLVAGFGRWLEERRAADGVAAEVTPEQRARW